MICSSQSKGVLIQFDQNTTHVVTAQLLLCWVLAQKFIEHLLKYLLWALSLYPIVSHLCYQILAIFFIPLPNAITAHQNKVIFLAKLYRLYVWMACYCLSLVRKLSILLVVQITQASWKIEMIVDSSSLYLSPWWDDSFVLYRIFRFVIIRKFDNLSFSA